MASGPATTPLKIGLIGNPNTGKSTLFNLLAGMNARVGNYPGVTVEKTVGSAEWDGRAIELIDLPGTYSLAARSLDEIVSVDVLLGYKSNVGELDGIVCVTNAANLERNLFLTSQILDLGRPVVLVLNMWDTTAAANIQIDLERLRSRLGIPVVPTSANRGEGLDELRSAILQCVNRPAVDPPRPMSAEFYAVVEELRSELNGDGNAIPNYLFERAILDAGGPAERRLTESGGAGVVSKIDAARNRLPEAQSNAGAEAQARYKWARSVLEDVVTGPTAARTQTATDRIDRVLTNRWLGLLFFAGLMLLVFQTIYSWAGPLMDACESLQTVASGFVEGLMGPGALRSLLTDGIIAGVGGVLIFLPQIALLFLFIAVLEDCGYMARAAFIMDRIMARFGLSGKSFVPLMSSFACAVPGVMATRVIDNRQERMVTIMVAPLMSCSARLPVYLLMIGAFIPATTWLGGWLSLQGLVLFAMTFLGAAIAIPVAWLLKSTFFRGEPAPFVMELPEYKVPSARVVLSRVFDRSKAFVMRAGTMIFAATILVWAAGYFPGDHTRLNEIDTQLESQQLPEAEVTALRAERNLEGQRLIEGSFLGQAGRAIEPLVRPLGWDWRIGIGALASFPAREVIIATLGTIYSLGGDVDEEDAGLRSAMSAAKWPDGRPVFTIPVALSVMVFFALCAQCVSTLVVIRRETNSWGWTIFSFVYMTVLAWLGAFVTYQVGSMIA